MKRDKHLGKGILALGLALSAAVAGAFDSSVVDNRFGTDRRYGSCVLGPCLPHGSAHPSPDSQWPSPNPHPVTPGQRHGAGAPTSGWWPDDPIVGFSQLHCQGSGGQPSYGIFRLGIPTSSMTVEEAHPYRFQASFPEAKLRVSIVPTAHGALYRIASETLKPSEIVLDRKCKIASTDCINKEGLFTGNWNPNPYACFAATEADDAAGLVRIAVSFKSQEQAEAYLRDELVGKSFDDLVAAAKARWDAHLSRIRIEGVDEDERRRFYSHFMHTFVQPRDRTADGIGWDDHCTLWDTWRTLHPLLMLVDPEAAAGIVNSFGDRFARTGCCETAYTSGKEFKTGQGGDEADVVLADAIVKELPGLEVEKLLPLLESRWNGRTGGYRERGYVAVGEHDDYCGRMKSGSATMSFAWEDWCVGTALTKLGRDGSRFLERAGNWTNVWDETAFDEPSGFRGFVRARNAGGSFRSTQPRQGFNSDFYEANCWEYSLFVLQDFEGMVARCGGREAFVQRLEYAHDHDLIDFGNEPAFHAPWLFALAGRPDLTVKWAKKLAAIFPKEACPGDDDSGAMGALYVFLKCGIYPIPVRGLYVLHGSAYPRIVLTLPASGKTLEIVSENLSSENEILEAVYLNGRRLESPVLTHAELIKGGKLTFVWGKAKGVM